MSEEKKKEEKPPVKKSQKKKPPPTANIIFVGRIERINKEAGKKETVSKDAPARLVDGETVIKLPVAALQKKGFYHEKATQIIALFPDDYKMPVSKNGAQGDK